MRTRIGGLTTAFISLLFLLAGIGAAQATPAFQVTPNQLSLVIAQGFNHCDVSVPISGTAPGFDFSTLISSSDSAWVTPTIDTSHQSVHLTFSTSTLVTTTNTATITVSGGGTTATFFVNAAVSPLKIVKFVSDPIRTRTYGLQQNGVGGGAVVVVNPLTNAKLGCITVGNKPGDLAISADGSELLVINTVDQTLSTIDPSALQVTGSISLPQYTNWGASDTTAHVAYGKGSILYYTDGSWAPVLHVYNRATKQVLQNFTDTTSSNGVGNFALTPDGTSLFFWAQYGWSAGSAGSFIVKCSVAANGTVTEVDHTTASYPNGLLRDPLDTPVLIDAAGQNAFLKQYEVSTAAVNSTTNSFPTPVYAISPGGEIAATSTALFQTSTGLNVYTLPKSSDVQSITPDYARLVYFDSTAAAIGTIDLLAAVGPSILGRTLSPVDGSITLSPPTLQWSSVPGVQTYQVYLGQSQSDVAAATTSSPLYLSQVNTPGIAVPGTLTPGTKYYWRIDSVTTAGVESGPVYSFTVSVIGADKTSITTATVQGASDNEIVLNLSSATGSTPWAASADQPWVSFASATGTAPGTLTVILDATKLAAGVQTATVTLTSGGQPAFSIPVRLQVDPLTLTVMKSDPTSALIYAISENTATAGVDRAYLLAIDSATRAITKVVRVGSSATDIAIQNAEQRIYVTNWMLGSLLALDKTTLQQVQAYAVPPFDGVGYSENDVFNISAGAKGRLVVEGEDQWVDMSIFNTAGTGSRLATDFVRAGAGGFAPGGQFYYHGDSDISDASIYKYDVSGDVFTLKAQTAGQNGADYYGSTTLVVTEDGQHVFWNGIAFDGNLNVLANLKSEIYSATPDGRYGFGQTQIFDVTLGKAVFSMPVSTDVSAYNSTTGLLVLQAGAQIGFYSLNSTTTLTPPVLSVQSFDTSSVHLSWVGSALQTGFTLQEQVGTSGVWQNVSSTIAASASTYTVSGLSPGTAYQFRIQATATNISSDWSNVVSVTTATPPPPVVVTTTATNLTTTSTARLNGTVNPSGSSTAVSFEYGSTTDYGSSTAAFGIGSGTTVQTVGVTVSFPGPGAYHFRLNATNAGGTTHGNDLTVTVLGPVIVTPIISTGLATNVTTSAAVLSGMVNPNGASTTAYFIYGAGNYGSSTTAVNIGNSSSAQNVQATLNGLISGVTYQYELVAQNSTGTFYGSSGTFTTQPSVVVLPIGPIANNDTAYTDGRQPVQIPVLANDIASSGALRLVAVGPASLGQVTFEQGGSVVYRPGAKFQGVDSFSYTITDDSGQSATASVTVIETRLEAAGVYNSLLGTNESDFEQSGSVMLTLSRGGAFTGSLKLGGVSHPVLGTLREDGGGSYLVRTSDEGPLQLTFTIDPLAGAMTGSVLSQGALLPFTAQKAPYTGGQNAAPQAGRYTVLLPLASGDANSPQGYATMTVAGTGAVTLTGHSPTGKAFSAAARLGASNRFPLYGLGGSKPISALRGWVTVDGTGASGSIGWSSAMMTRKAHAPTVIAESDLVQLALAGALYHPPAAKTIPLGATSTTGNATLQLSSSVVAMGASTNTVAVTLTSTRLVSASSAVSGLTLNLEAGTFSGTLTLQGAKLPFSGVLYAPANTGVALVTYAGSTAGSLTLTPTLPPTP